MYCHGVYPWASWQFLYCFSSQTKVLDCDSSRLDIDRPLKRCCDCFKLISVSQLRAFVRLGLLMGQLFGIVKIISVS